MRHIVEYYPDAEVIPGCSGQPEHPQNSLPLKRFRQKKPAPLPGSWVSLHPKHGSWLNIAELELAVLSNMCLSQRIADEGNVATRDRPMFVNATPKPSPSKVEVLPLRMLGVNLLVFILAFQRDWLLGLAL